MLLAMFQINFVLGAEVLGEVAGVTFHGTSIETPLHLLFLEWQKQWSFIKLILFCGE